MSTQAAVIDGCAQRLVRDPRTGFSDCPGCGFHGRPDRHLAYSIARQHGLNAVRAQAFATGHRALLAQALAERKPRSVIAAQLIQLARAAAEQYARRTPAPRA